MPAIIGFGKPIKSNQFKKYRLVNAMMPKGFGNKITAGVYMLKYGEYFYIGSSYHIKKRIKQHITILEKAIMSGEIKDRCMKPLFDIMVKDKNRYSNLLFVEVLDLANDTLSDLKEKEQNQLNRHYCNEKCLNNSGVATKSWLAKSGEQFSPGVFKIEIKIDNIKEYLEYKKLSKKFNVVSQDL